LENKEKQKADLRGIATKPYKKLDLNISKLATRAK
jgi:hypothetical protein